MYSATDLTVKGVCVNGEGLFAVVRGYYVQW